MEINFEYKAELKANTAVRQRYTQEITMFTSVFVYMHMQHKNIDNFHLYFKYNLKYLKIIIYCISNL